MTKQKLLIIEDDRSLSDVLVYNFKHEGFDVYRALDGQDGVNQALVGHRKSSSLTSCFLFGWNRSLPPIAKRAGN